MSIFDRINQILYSLNFIKINKDDEEEKKQDDETAEMKIVKEIRENMKNDDVVINFTDYEKDQEEKAIISYDELLNKSNKYGLNYENVYRMHEIPNLCELNIGHSIISRSVFTGLPEAVSKMAEIIK